MVRRATQPAVFRKSKALVVHIAVFFVPSPKVVGMVQMLRFFVRKTHLFVEGRGVPFFTLPAGRGVLSLRCSAVWHVSAGGAVVVRITSLFVQGP